MRISDGRATVMRSVLRTKVSHCKVVYGKAKQRVDAKSGYSPFCVGVSASAEEATVFFIEEKPRFFLEAGSILFTCCQTQFVFRIFPCLSGMRNTFTSSIKGNSLKQISCPFSVSFLSCGRERPLSFLYIPLSGFKNSRRPVLTFSTGLLFFILSQGGVPVISPSFSQNAASQRRPGHGWHCLSVPKSRYRGPASSRMPRPSSFLSWPNR